MKNIDKKIIQKSKNIKVKSNTSKNKFLSMVNKAKKYIKLVRFIPNYCRLFSKIFFVELRELYRQGSVVC